MVLTVLTHFLGSIGYDGGMRYRIVGILFRARFPRGGTSYCDFRPHFDGYIVNFWSIIDLRGMPPEIRKRAFRRWASMLDWIRMLRFLFGYGDRVQVIVGHAKGQLLKGWLPANRLRHARADSLDSIGGAMAEIAPYFE